MEEEKVPGVIENLSAGFATVTTRPWLIIIPVLLDIGFWLGPRLSIAPLLRKASALLSVPPGAPTEYLGALGDVRTMVQQAASSLNLFTLLSPRLLGVPSLTLLDRPAMQVIGAPAVLEIRSYVGLLGATILLGLIGLLIGCLYLKLIAQQVQEEPLSIAHLSRRLWVYWLRMATVTGLLVIISVVAAFPLAIVLTMTALLSGGAASLFLALLWGVLFWVGLYFFFVPRAIVLSDAGVWESLWISFQLVRSNFWATLGLVGLIYLIGAGLGLIWEALPGGTWADVASIVGNAYIGTGLMTATFIFYRDRYAARLGNVQQTTRSTQEG